MFSIQKIQIIFRTSRELYRFCKFSVTKFSGKNVLNIKESSKQKCDLKLNKQYKERKQKNLIQDISVGYSFKQKLLRKVINT